MNAQQFQAGDTVHIHPYQSQSLRSQGQWDPGHCSDKDGVVIELRPHAYGFASMEDVVIRVLSADGKTVSYVTRPVSSLDLVTRGPGYIKLGETHPYTEVELKELRWKAFVDKCESHDLRVEGFPNYATYLAELYLRQEPRFHARLQYLWRQDGSINPRKVEKAFREMKLEIDAAAFECPFDIPPEFADYGNPVRSKQTVVWSAVAAEFSRPSVQ